MYCINCGNQITVKTDTCPYCQKPLPVSTTASRSLRSCIITISTLIMAAGFAIALFVAFPDLSKIFSKKPVQPESPKPRPEKLGRTAESDKASLNELYKRYLDTLENPEPQNFRKFVQKKRLNELNEDGTNSLIYDQLVPDITMIGVEVSRVIVEGDRAIIVTRVERANQITDNKGNPLGATGIAKLIYEENGWKIFSQVWHISPLTDPVEESMSWLTSNADNAAANELLSLGVEYGEAECLDAISRSRADVVKLCLQAGFSPNTPWMGEATAFDNAASQIANGDEEDLEIIKAMLAAGANVDSTTGGALTPLMQASMSCKPEFVEVLIQGGANVNYTNEAGLTPFGLAQNCPKVKKILKRHGAK